MVEAIIGIIIGIACIVIGVLNMKGNIKMLHSYHINNIKEEDKIPFGRLVGIGTLVIGISLIIYGSLNVAYTINQNDLFVVLSNILLVIGLIIGICICLFAIKKYNKKIIG